MILQARHLLHFAIATVTCGAALPGLAGNVYVAARNDGRGSGSQSDPYDGASPSRFDALIARFPSGTDFHYAAGTYHTYGYHYPQENIHAHCRHFGAGIDKTIIQLVSSSSPSGTIFSADYNQSADGYEMHDLTLDCNAANNPIFQDGRGAVTAVNIQGNDILFENVKIIHFGTGKRGTECFAFYSYPSDVWRGHTFRNVKLDHVTFTNPVRGNRDGCTISVLGASEGVDLENTQIVNCQYLDCDSDFTYAHALGALDNENNYVRTCSNGAYFEPNDRQNRTIVYRNNTFENVEKAVLINWHPGATLGNIIFDNNKVTVRTNRPNNAAIGVNDSLHNGDASSRLNSIEFENNTVGLASFGPFSSLCRALDLRSPGHHYTIGKVVVSGNHVSGLPTGVPYNIQKDIVGSLSVH